MKEKISICFACDDGYAPYMGMAIFSILRNAGIEENFHFYILDNSISAENKLKIEKLKERYSFQITYLKLDDKIFKDCDVKRSSWTKSIFGRYLIPELITDDKVLYLDCDIFVRDSLLPLWKEDISDYYLAGAVDYNVVYRGDLEKRFNGQLNPMEYVNSGVLLINNKKWREDNLFKVLLEYSIKNAELLKWPDQDAINYICRDYKKIISSKWNVMGYLYKPDLFLDSPNYHSILKEREKAVIRHFHPWRKNEFSPTREEYLGLMRISPWSNLVPKDDIMAIAFIKKVLSYLWKHPFCFLSTKFYRRWKIRGTVNLFFDNL